jgi:hypothetical protein
MTIDDLNITLADGAANASAANGAGITVDGASATLTYSSTGDKWVFNKDLDVTGNTDTDTLNVSGVSTFGNTIDIGTNYIYGDLGSGTRLRVGSQAEFRTLRNLTIIADDDDSSTSEALTLGAGQNSLVVTSNAGSTDNNKLTYNGNIVWHAGNDGTGTGLDADTVDGLEASSFLRSDADDTTTGQIQLTKANSTATNGGQIYLNGTGGGRIDYNQSGVAGPAFTTRSVGTKIVLYPEIGATNSDYAFGIESGTLWYSVPTAAVGKELL